jgi:hypothetical protein
MAKLMADELDGGTDDRSSRGPWIRRVVYAQFSVALVLAAISLGSRLGLDPNRSLHLLGPLVPLIVLAAVLLCPLLSVANLLFSPRLPSLIAVLASILVSAFILFLFIPSVQ